MPLKTRAAQVFKGTETKLLHYELAEEPTAFIWLKHLLLCLCKVTPISLSQFEWVLICSFFGFAVHPMELGRVKASIENKNLYV